jgi:hypothetical protein
MVQTTKRLTKHLYDIVGDGLRTVVVVQHDDIDIEYLREDLEEKYTMEMFAEVIDEFRFEQPLMSPDVKGKPVGERRAVIHYHKNAFVLQFPRSASETILVSLSRDTGIQLLQFIENCRTILEEGSNS